MRVLTGHLPLIFRVTKRTMVRFCHFISYIMIVKSTSNSHRNSTCTFINLRTIAWMAKYSTHSGPVDL